MSTLLSVLLLMLCVNSVVAHYRLLVRALGTPPQPTTAGSREASTVAWGPPLAGETPAVRQTGSFPKSRHVDSRRL